MRDDDREDKLYVPAIHDESGYRQVRQTLAEQVQPGLSREPNIQVWSVDVRGDRSLTLRHTQHNRRPLGPNSADEVLQAHRPAVGL